MDSLSPDPTSVYRYYDQNNLLLYVGITRRGGQRNREHNDTKAWWSHVVRQEVEHFPNRRIAADQERALIRKFRPPFNVQHNPGHEHIRAAYESLAGLPISSKPHDPRQILRSINHKMPLERVDAGGKRALLMCRPEHNPLASNLRWNDRVILRAPKKVAELSGYFPTPHQTAFEFTAIRGDVPKTHMVMLQLKVRSEKPLLIDMHEGVTV